jgi:membrane protease YdiL (CAAX protease family)
LLKQHSMEAVFALVGVWSLLLVVPELAVRVGAGAALLCVHAAATALLLATRPRGAAPLAASPRVLVAAWTAGCVSYPGWIGVTWLVGNALGLPPRAGGLSGAAGPAAWLAVLLLAPVFEELLYRERLLDALRVRLGSPAAVAASSALFALPHAEPWHIIATFLVGLGLAAGRCAGASLAACMAYHAGLNAAAWLAGQGTSDPVLNLPTKN